MQVENVIYREQINTKTFSGSLICPASETGTLHTIIMLPGSSGSVSEKIAEHIASYGYSVLALKYSKANKQPSHLEGVSLESLSDAILWLKEKALIKAVTITLLGYSRGGELALLFGSQFPKLINGIIAYVPSSFVCGGFPYPNKPAWLLKNKPVAPFLKGLMSNEESLTEKEDLQLATEKGIIPHHSNDAQDPFVSAELFLVREKALQNSLSAAIRVENITCPILIISGGKDKIWPSSRYAQQISERLENYESPIERKFLDFPEAGHGIFSPYDGPIHHAVGGFWCAQGGTPDGNKNANQAAWMETFAFLERVKERFLTNPK